MWRIWGQRRHCLYSILIPSASNMLPAGSLLCGSPLFLHSAEAPGKEGDGCCQGDLHLIFPPKCSRQSSTENKQILWVEAQLKTSIKWRRDAILQGLQIQGTHDGETWLEQILQNAWIPDWEPEFQPCKIVLLISMLPLYSMQSVRVYPSFCVSEPSCAAMTGLFSQ